MTTKSAIATTTPFPGVPMWIDNPQEFLLKAKNTINNTLMGKMNSVGTFTLNASTVSTSVKFQAGLIGPNTKMIWYPLTANAAAVAYDGSMFLSTVDPLNSVIGLTHTSDANTNKTFAYVIIG